MSKADAAAVVGVVLVAIGLGVQWGWGWSLVVSGAALTTAAILWARVGQS